VSNSESDARKEARRKGFDDPRGIANSSQGAAKPTEAEKADSSPPPFVTGPVAMVPPPAPSPPGGVGPAGNVEEKKKDEERAKTSPSTDKAIEGSGNSSGEFRKSPALTNKVVLNAVRPPTVQVGPMRAVWLKSPKG